MPMRIDVSLAEWPACSSPSSEEQIQVLKERLSATPTKDPEERAQSLAARTARTALLHKLEMEAKLEKAKRANDLVKENRARKLRMEAAAYARASSKIEKATRNETEHEATKQAKREAAATRRAALFEAVRAAREARQFSREQRQAELAKLEANAASIRAKKIESTVSRSSAQVQHAHQVAARLKEKEKEEAAASAAALADRISAATSRRQERLEATIESAAWVVNSAEKVRLRHLYHEKATIEEQRARLAKSMDKALIRREEKLESITSRVAAENARVADVVAESRMKESTTKPAVMRHALTARLQAAQVRRLEALNKVSSASKLSSSPSSSRHASLEATPKSSPMASPLTEAPPTPWSASSPPLKTRKPEPIIIVNTDAFQCATPAPSSQLLSRLQFRPRMLLATAPARHASAAGRRQTRLNLDRARASHFGTVRVAVVRGRRTAREELARSVTEVRMQRAGERAVLHIRAKARTAARLNERINTAKVNRSNLRLSILHAAMAKEEKRLAAHERLSATLRLRKEGRYEEAKTFAVMVRRAAAMERLISRGAELQKRCMDANSRREAALSAIASCSAVRCRSSAALQRAAARDAEIEDAEAVHGKTMDVEPTAKDATPRAAIKPAKAEGEAKVEVEHSTDLSSLPVIDLDTHLVELRLLIEKQLEAATAKSVAEVEATGIADQHGGSMRKAANISAAGAAKAEARAEAKRAAKVSAQAVKASVSKAAAMTCRHGRKAKSHEAVDADDDAVIIQSAAYSSAPSFSAASAASCVVSDSEEWYDVAGEKFKIAD